MIVLHRVGHVLNHVLKHGSKKRFKTVIKDNCSFCLLNIKNLCVILHPVQILLSKICRLLQLKVFQIVMGRNRHEIWAFFTEKNSDDGTIRAECDRCGKSMVSLVARMRTHHQACASMMPVELTKAKNFIKAIEPDLTPELTLYMAKESPYVPDLFDENNQDVRPVAWWKSGARIGFSDKLVTIALSLVTAVGSSAGLERQFSTLGMTYGKLRNQLGHEKAGQLAFCYRQLNKNN